MIELLYDLTLGPEFQSGIVGCLRRVLQAGRQKNRVPNVVY